MAHTVIDTAGHIDHGKALQGRADREGWTERRGDVRVLLERHR